MAGSWSRFRPVKETVLDSCPLSEAALSGTTINSLAVHLTTSKRRRRLQFDETPRAASLLPEFQSLVLVSFSLDSLTSHTPLII